MTEQTTRGKTCGHCNGEGTSQYATDGICESCEGYKRIYTVSDVRALEKRVVSHIPYGSVTMRIIKSEFAKFLEGGDAK